MIFLVEMRKEWLEKWRRYHILVSAVVLLLFGIPDMPQDPQVGPVDCHTTAKQRAGAQQSLQLDRAAVRDRDPRVAESMDQLDVAGADVHEVHVAEQLVESSHVVYTDRGPSHVLFDIQLPPGNQNVGQLLPPHVVTSGSQKKNPKPLSVQ